MARYDVVVIGAGLGGLTAGAILARAGRKVLVIERSNSVGGAASSYKSGDLFIEGSLQETSDPHASARSQTRRADARGRARRRQVDSGRRVVRGARRPARPAVRDAGQFRRGAARADRSVFRKRATESINCSTRWSASRRPWATLAQGRKRSRSDRRSARCSSCVRRSATGRCRCRKNSIACSATTKPSNARWPPTCPIFTTIRRRCGGSFSRWRREAIC